MTEEDALRWLVDETFRAGKEMIRTHHMVDKLRFVKLARIVESHGYVLTWYKHRGVIGIQHKEVTNGNANQGSNGSGNSTRPTS